MEEPIIQEVIPAEMPSYNSLLGKWLYFLFPVQVAGLVITLLTDFAPKTVLLLSYGLMVCVPVLFFKNGISTLGKRVLKFTVHS